jgi:hypothetical protein
VTAAIGNAANDVHNCNNATGTGTSAEWTATDTCAPAGGGTGTTGG